MASVKQPKASTDVSRPDFAAHDDGYGVVGLDLFKRVNLLQRVNFRHLPERGRSEIVAVMRIGVYGWSDRH